MSQQQQPWSGIQIETSFFPLSFFLYACTPRIVIDGVVQQRPWGTHSIPLQPGMHNLKVYFRYLFMDTCGLAQMNVVVQQPWTSFEMRACRSIPRTSSDSHRCCTTTSTFIWTFPDPGLIRREVLEALDR